MNIPYQLPTTKSMSLFQVLDGLKSGTAALKKVHEILSIDEIEQIMEESKEGIEKQREIDAVISGELTQEDEDAVEAELEAILDVGDKLPDVPADALPEPATKETPEKVTSNTKRVALEA